METGAVLAAASLAAELHSGHRYGAHPYTFHTSAVASVLSEVFAHHPMREVLICAGHLHDVLEDSLDIEAASGSILRELGEFGPVVLEIVKAVTDEPGRSRSERAQRTRPKIAAAGWPAVAVKLADRMCNTRQAAEGRSDLFRMYRKEHPAFRADLCQVGSEIPEIASMWAELDGYFASLSIYNGGTGRCELGLDV